MSLASLLADKIIKENYNINKEEALSLYKEPLEELKTSADKIRRHFCGHSFDMCTIINGKSGHCSENCKFCAQSAHNHTGAEEYPLLDKDIILAQAKKEADLGVMRFSIVCSGRALPQADVDRLCEIIKEIKANVNIAVCVSVGLLKAEQFAKLKAAGAERVHNNLETSREFFDKICTTHSFEDKIKAIAAARAAGMEVCSGGIIGLGESEEDRINMAFTLREFNIKSVPVNVLNPIKGTPLENNKRLTLEEIERVVAVYRFILKDAYIRLAGGRGPMADKGRGCFSGGANAAISGDMLTTSGINVNEDKEIIRELGYSLGRV